MKKYYMMVVGIPVLSLANSWFMMTGFGAGMYQSDLTYQSEQHLIAQIASSLYSGMDGSLNYHLKRAMYGSNNIGDDNLFIAFQTKLLQTGMECDFGIGLGISHRENMTTSQVLNQSYVPFNLQIILLNDVFKNIGLSINADYFIHPPHTDALNGFSALKNRYEIGLHYNSKSLEYVLSYQNSNFSDNISAGSENVSSEDFNATTLGISGINTNCIEAQIIYHWHN